MNDLTNISIVMNFIFNSETFTGDEKQSKFKLFYTNLFHTFNEMQIINMKNILKCFL